MVFLFGRLTVEIQVQRPCGRKQVIAFLLTQLVSSYQES